ncbi:MAG: PKD domain-containing protein [Deltaproteobacteria bacterium]|nr:PKD domain-containing protein [Deltaproteobacteria bacterium]
MPITLLCLCLLFLRLPTPATAAPPRVICVPQVATDLLVPHDTWSGEPTILKGVAEDIDGDLAGGTFYWEYGDGGESTPQAIVNSDNLTLTHTFDAAPGTLFIARLHVTDAAGETAVGEYRLLIREKTLDVEINKAIDDGLWWLYTRKESVGDYSLIPTDAFTTPDNEPGLRGEYFNNTSLTGTPALTRTDPQINFNWGSGSPGPGVNNDFSARWTGTLQVPADGYYCFKSFNDDGTRLYVDGNLLIDDWHSHAPAERYSPVIYLAAGAHDFQLDFYDGCCGAQAKIYWSTKFMYRWSNEGYRYPGYYANSTASAVQAYEINGHLETGDPNQDPYVKAVRGGLDYLMTTLVSQNMNAQAGGHPEDYNNDGDGTNDGGNGIGLAVNSNRSIYETGAVMDALVATGTPAAVARTGGANVLGRRYQDIVQDMADMYAWGMDDSGNDRGGWRYSWNSDADNSASQWGAIGMVAAERHFGCRMPAWVKTENDAWLNHSYNGTGFGYDRPGRGWATTPSGMVQLSFDGRDTTDSRWRTAEKWLADNWTSFLGQWQGDYYYGYYAFAKAMRLALPQEVTHLSSGLDWYGDESSGLARHLVDHQEAEGYWPTKEWLGWQTATAWNVIILTRTLFEKPPVAVVHAEPNPGAVGQTIQFDASASYHVDPAKEIVEYRWDFDTDDGIDFEHPDGTGATAEHAYGDLGDYTVSLKVIDNSTPSRFDIGTYNIRITVPPHPPTANAGGPYLATVGEEVQVDGSGSFDIDASLGDNIVIWEWEADFEAPYDFGEASGQIATLPAFSTAGRQDIALRVTDNTAIAFPTAGSSDLDDVDYGEVVVYRAGVTDLHARPKGTKCQLTWSHIGAPLYEVLRSERGPNQGFALIGTTTSTYATYIDYNVVMNTDYWYRIRSEIGGETTLSGPAHVYSTGRIRNRPPVITSTPPLDAREEAPYAYDVQADDPEGTRITYLLDAAPDGMVINAASGQISWTPTREQVGLNEVVVRVNDSRRASASQFFQVVVAPRANTAPAAAPGGPYSGQVGETMTFSGNAVDPEGDPVAEYHWVFGDGTEADGQTATHVYAAAGDYVVTLYATDDRGAVGHAETKCLIGLANRPPIANAGGPYSGEVNQPVTVDGRQSDDPDSDPLTYTWNADTASGPLTGEQVDFTFTEVGTYEVTLTVADGRGGSDTATAEIVVTPPNEPPVSTFTHEPFLWNNLTFDGTGSHDPEGRPLAAWEWDFGDGVTTTGALASHLYAAAGNYTVRLTVTDNKGATTSCSQIIAITHPTPNNNPNIEAGGPYTGPLNTPITLTATGADPDGDPLTFTWSHDGQETTGEQVSLTFTEVGIYEVTLTADDGFGGQAVDTTQVMVFDPASSGNDTTPPVTAITSPASGTVLSGTVTFRGSVTDDNLVFWVLEYAPAGTEQWRTIATGDRNLDDDVLGRLNAEVLQDDLYRFRLRAQDQHYSVNSWIQCEVNSPLKLGQFSLEYIDLAMPLAGIPIKVVRRYDTRDAANQGDFGYGWQLGAADPQIRETVPVDPLEESLGFFVAKPYRVDTRIYLTNPDGQRVGFTFAPVPAPSLLGTVYIPKFTPDPGVHDRLEVDPIALTLRPDGTFVFFLIGLNYNPADFRLLRQDGTTYHYNQFNGLKKVGDRNGNELVYTHDGIFHSSGASVRFNRDAQDRIIEVVDPQNQVISYQYDASGNLTAVTDQENLTSSYGYFSNPAHYLESITDSLGHQAARYEYDDDGRLISFTNALGDRFEQAYDPTAFSGTFTDANGNVTQLFYDAQGNLIREVNPLGGEKRFTYDADRNKTTEIDENGNTTTYTYDDRGNVLTKSDAMGKVTTFTYNTFDEITKVVDSDGHTTIATYDDQGNLTRFTNPAGQTAAFLYDTYGRIKELVDFKGNRTVYEYSAGIAMPTKIINPDGTFKKYSYLWNGQIISLQDETGNTWTRTYDRDGRLVSETDALGNTTSYHYDGHSLTSKTCPLGYVTHFEYNNVNHIIRQTDHLGGVTNFTYDANGNRLSVTDPDGNKTQFVYDELNRLVMTIDPLNMRTSYTYDPAGNLIEQVDRNNRRRTFAYDAYGQLIRETWLDGAKTVNIINYGHDAAGNLTYIADNNSSLFFTYDATNNLLTADNTGTPGFPIVKLTYQYDSMGNLLSVADNLGVRINSIYDGRNHLLSRIWQGTGMTSSVRIDFSYNISGYCNLIHRFTDSNGLNLIGTSNLEYDALNRVTELNHTVVNSGTIIANYDYVYNAAGLLLTEEHHGDTCNYTYDAAGQLIKSICTAGNEENFSYDANGNRIGPNYVVGANNRILNDVSFDYDYDNEGNLISKTEKATGMVTTFTYDHRNHLVSFEKRDANGMLIDEASYIYDGLDRRIVATINGQTVLTAYDGDHAWADFDAVGNLITRYLFGDGPDALIARSQSNGEIGWYLADKLSTVRDLIDTNGMLLNHVDYNSFGGIIAQMDIDKGDRFLFTGREYEPTSGLYFYRTRYYDPFLGRFLSEDPLKFDGGDLNLYRYVNNSPLNGTDPTGRQAIVSNMLIFACTSIKAVQAADAQIKIWLPPLLAVRDVLKTGHYTKYTPPTWTDMAVDLGFKYLPSSPCGLPTPVIDQYKDLIKWALNNIWFPRK